MVQPKLILQPGNRLFSAPIAELRPHPAFEKLGLAPDVARFSSLAKRGDAAFGDIVHVTPLLQIIDGYELVQFARSRNRSEVFCLRVEVNEEEGLLALLQKHQGIAGMKPFVRILLALELEEWLRCKARSNQSRGGQMKGLSDLTEAFTIDVRKELAAAAGVSVGNISKAKNVLTSAAPEILEATKHGEMTLHKAWSFSKLDPLEQKVALRRYQSERGIKKIVRKLLSAQQPTTTQLNGVSADYLRGFLASLGTSALDEGQLRKGERPSSGFDGSKGYTFPRLLRCLKIRSNRFWQTLGPYGM